MPRPVRCRRIGQMPAIYESARHKIATALVQGKRLQITGGCCEFAPVPPPEHLMMKGSQNMRIAIPYEQGEIFQHFGHTEQFKLYDVENGTIIREQIINTNGSGHGARRIQPSTSRCHLPASSIGCTSCSSYSPFSQQNKRRSWEVTSLVS